MMKPIDGGQIHCPCCKKCTDCTTGFQKVVDLKNAGLVVYRHTTQTEDVNKLTGETELATKTTEDVYILHNTKDVDITTAHHLPEIKQNTVNCLRCRRILDHAQKLLQKVPAINRNDVRGICEHCRTKDAPCFECKNVAKKFIACKAERIKNTEERVKQWLAKIKHLLKDAAVDEIEVIRKGTRAHSELHIDQLCPETTNQREPDVKQMFQSEAEGADFTGIFPPSIEKRKKMFAHFPQLEKVERPVVFLDAPKKAREPTTSYLYRRIRDKDGFSDESEEFEEVISGKANAKERYVAIRDAPPVPCHSEVEPTAVTKPTIKGGKANSSKTNYQDETLQFDQIFKPIDMDKKQFQKHGKAILIRRGLSQRHETDPDTGMLPSKPEQRVLHGKTEPLIRKYHSEEMLLTTDSGVTGKALKQGFSYVFPKIIPDKNKLHRQKSSSELIKDTQDKLSALEKPDLEVKLKEQRKTDKTPIKEKPTPTASTTSSKKVKKDVDKVNKNADKQEADKAKREADKAKKDEEKAKRDEEKAKKDQMQKEKADSLKKEKEEKERLKKEKKDQQQNEKADSLKKDKEEKERLKKEKQDQQNEKAERQKKEKEEKERQKKEIEERERQRKEKEEQKRKENESKQQKKDNDESSFPQKSLAEREKSDKQKSRAMLQMLQTKEDEVGVKPEKPKPLKSAATTNTKDLNVKSVQNRSIPDFEILKLIRARKAAGGERPKKLSDMALKVEDVIRHKDIHKHNRDCTCMMCCDSTIELDAESILNKMEKDLKEEIIIGHKIFVYKGPHHPQKQEDRGDFVPLFFQSKFDDTAPVEEQKVPIEGTKKGKPPPPVTNIVPKGVIRYSLSDRSFIEKGWTMLPTEKVVRKMNMYRMRPVHPEFDWFVHNKHKRQMEYDTGEKLAEFDDIGRGRWFYRNGRMALDYYDAEETNANQRFVIYSNGEPDERGRSRPYTLLATFDYLGNGAVFDHSGKIRMKYNQTEGVVLDRSIGPVSHWQWHTLNDPPVLQKVMIDTQMEHKDPKIMVLGPEGKKTRLDNEDMLTIEFQNFVKEKSKKLSQSFKPFQIKMKALKINEHFSLKVLDQATVYLIFRDGKTNIKLNIGMVLDHKEIVDTDSAEVGQVMSNVERLPARTNSLAELQKNIENAQQTAKLRIRHEQRLRPTMPVASADQLVAAASRPLRAHLATARSGSTTTAADCYCRCSRKPAETNVYCVNRLC